MKKNLALLLAPLILGGLAGCSDASSSKVAITFGREYDSSLNEANDYSVEQHFDEILRSDLTSMVNDKKNFILLVYDKDSTCSCWGSLSKKIDEFMATHNARIFGIQFNLINGHEDDYGLTLSSGNNTIAIFEDGAMKYQYVTVSTDEPLSEGTAFDDWMMERVSFSNFNYITLSQLNSLFKGEEGEVFTVYFGRSSCGDCAYIENHLLKSRASTTLKNTIYALDCDVPGIRYDENGEYDGEQWQAFKDQYGLSSTNNEMGYGLGYVPTFIHYMPYSGNEVYANAVLDMAVYLNDAVDVDTLTVTTSYYDGTRTNGFLDYVDEEDRIIAGVKVEAADLDENGNWLKEKASVYHDPIITAFIDLYGGLLD